MKSELCGILERLHVLVIGPGLGREEYMQKYARLALRLAREREMYVVLDADALWMVQKDLEAVKGYHKAVLTPNVAEFKRLSECVVRFSGCRTFLHITNEGIREYPQTHHLHQWLLSSLIRWAV